MEDFCYINKWKSCLLLIQKTDRIVAFYFFKKILSGYKLIGINFINRNRYKVIKSRDTSCKK